MLRRSVQKAFSTLIIGEHNNQTLSSNTLKTITASKQFNQETHLFIAGHETSSLLEHINSITCNHCFSKLLLAEHPALTNQLADHYCAVLYPLIQEHKYQQIMMSTSSFGKDLLPRLAAKFNTMAISDVTAIDSNEHSFTRPIYAGNAIANYQYSSDQNPKFISIRPSNYEPSQKHIDAQSVQPTPLDVVQSIQNISNPIVFVNNQMVVSERPDLQQAKIVVSGGRALKSQENFQIIQELADKLNAAIGASRAAVDAGYIGNDHQVGQTGKIVAPELYIAVGISGAIQHVAGMKDSKVIVSINKDSEAPIFQISDYGLVGDLFKILPELTQKL